MIKVAVKGDIKERWGKMINRLIGEVSKSKRESGGGRESIGLLILWPKARREGDQTVCCGGDEGLGKQINQMIESIPKDKVDKRGVEDSPLDE